MALWPERLLAETQLGQARIADHQVAGDHRHLDGDLPFPVLALRRRGWFFGALQSVPSLQFCRDPGIGALKFPRS